MRISVVARRNCTLDPHAQPLLTTLVAAGHDVTVLRATTGDPGTWPGVATASVPPEQPSLGTRIRRRMGRFADVDQPAGSRAWSDLLSRSSPDLQYATRPDDLDLVDATLSPVVRLPGWPVVDRDLIDIAPDQPELAVDPVASTFHCPDDRRPATTPPHDRFSGQTVVVAARTTPTNPSRYIIEALARAGTEVVVMDGVIDWGAVPRNTAGIVVVESPYPALGQIGTKRDAPPVLYWVHHGEHHLYANLRLAARYHADAILLAHSWHLAHRFPMPVHRFPFGVDPVLFGGGRPWEDRDIDVAMIAAGLGQDNLRYPRRSAWEAALTEALGERAFLRYGIPPEEMARIYGRSRVVLNDGGTRHYPITMRVFEAIGAGARLLTENLPGMTQLFVPDEHFATISSEDVVGQVERQGAPAVADLARAAHAHALGRHTYDHRVDELFDHFAATPRTDATPRAAPNTPLAALIDADVDVHTVASLGAEVDLPDRSVRHDDDAAARMPDSRFDAVAVMHAGINLGDVARSARRYVYAGNALADRLGAELRTCHDHVTRTEHDAITRFDLHAPGYRMRGPDHPLAGE